MDRRGKWDKDNRKKVRDDVNVMKETLSGHNKEEYLAFQEKVSNIL